ncbi:hypothetical protein [Flavivirga spongiicola]|uniref:Uncharacterized protein n=1 Tax=Flavivirga spongiicola TaxID=421621 RepID=A0ABU7XSZ3_9FLAO|nr:hypothetical protein [Flavivirga sp. MEBiC05379]MDO5978691.1 hypothetical protein [Flavivirga sp. MEBiC05379]
MKTKIIELISDYPFYCGCLFLIIGVISLTYKIKKKKSLKKGNYNIASWNALINSWALIVIAFVFGIILIFK